GRRPHRNRRPARSGRSNPRHWRGAREALPRNWHFRSRGQIAFSRARRTKEKKRRSPRGPTELERNSKTFAWPGANDAKIEQRDQSNAPGTEPAMNGGAVPTVNSIPLAQSRGADAPHHRGFAQTDLVYFHRALPISSFAQGGDRGAAPPTQCAAKKSAETARLQDF